MTTDAAPSPASRRLHPLTPLVRILDGGVQAIFAVFAALTANPVLLAALAVGWASTFVQYVRFTWEFDGTTLRTDEGVLGRRHRSLTVDRIQQVDLHQNPVHRLFGTARVLVESAGGAKGADITLNVLGLDDARSLRDAIDAAKRRLAATPAGTPAGTDSGDGGAGAPDGEADGEAAAVPAATVVVDDVPYGELALAGITGPELLTGVAAAAALTEIAGEQIAEALEDAALGVAGGVGVAAAVAVAWLAVAAASSVLTNGDFRMVLTDTEVQVRRGLLGRKEEATPRRRVQLVEIRQSPLRRMLRRAAVRVVAAGNPGQHSRDRLTVPLLRVDRAPAVAAAVLSMPDPRHLLADLDPAPARARTRWQRRGAALGAAAAAVGSVAGAVAGAPALHLAWLLVPLGVAYGNAAHRALGHRVGDGLLVTRRGVLARRVVVMPIAKCQSTRLRSSPFQRRLHLATLHADVAGGASPPAVIDQDIEVLAVLAPTLAAGGGGGERDGEGGGGGGDGDGSGDLTGEGDPRRAGAPGSSAR